MKFSTSNIFPGSPPVLFVHIEKTAGSSIHKALYKSRLPSTKIPDTWNGSTIINYHRPAAHYQKTLGSNFDKHFKFSFVRNPWTKVVSHWFYIKRFHRFNKEIRTFDDFIFQEHNWTATVFRSQKKFLADNNGSLLVDYVGRFENIENDFQEVCKKTNISINHLTKENKSSSAVDINDIYTKETKKRVEELCREDIEYFEYNYS